MRAFAPGSVTGIFAPPPPGADRKRSRGASFATADGVVADVRPAESVSVTLDGEPASVEPVAGVLERLGATARVDLELSIPIGSGFGSSGAATLATALAANEVFDLGHGREALLRAAHESEVAAGTGLGDVFIQEAGGLRWSVGEYEMRSTTPPDRVEYDSLGSIATSDVLGDPETLDRIRTAGTRALDGLPDEPTMRAFTAAAWEFARATGLVTDRLLEEVERLRDAGGAASMAMLGETVFAVGVEGELPNATTVAPEGARLLDG
ncbi:MAG: GHMP kinase [Halobacteriales archaeon]|nr:GHMP kinase [Halobacteriales archaeon]